MIYIIIPAYNEEKAIGPVARDIFSLYPAPFQKNNSFSERCGVYPEARVVVVDDGSSDRTAELAQEAGALVLSHLINRGQGAALRTGTEYALSKGAEIIVHFDADGQFDPRDIGRLIEPVRKGEAEVVLGSRFLGKGRESGVPPCPACPDEWSGRGGLRGGGRIPLSKRYLILPVARLVNFLFTGLWLSDAHNGLRVLSRRAAEMIEITQDRMAHNSEIVAQIKKHRLSFREVPVAVRYREYGQGLGGGFKILRDLLVQRISNS